MATSSPEPYGMAGSSGLGRGLRQQLRTQTVGTAGLDRSPVEDGGDEGIKFNPVGVRIAIERLPFHEFGEQAPDRQAGSPSPSPERP